MAAQAGSGHHRIRRATGRHAHRLDGRSERVERSRRLSARLCTSFPFRGLRQKFSCAAARGPARSHHALRKRSEEHTYELQSLMRNSYAVFCLKKKKKTTINHKKHTN